MGSTNTEVRRRQYDGRFNVPSEAFSFGLRKVLNETVQIPEALSFGLRKVLNETVNISESVNLGLRKIINETVNIAEVIVKLVEASGIIKVIDETIQIAEALSFATRTTAMTSA